LADRWHIKLVVREASFVKRPFFSLHASRFTLHVIQKLTKCIQIVRADTKDKRKSRLKKDSRMIYSKRQKRQKREKIRL